MHCCWDSSRSRMILRWELACSPSNMSTIFVTQLHLQTRDLGKPGSHKGFSFRLVSYTPIRFSHSLRKGCWWSQVQPRNHKAFSCVLPSICMLVWYISRDRTRFAYPLTWSSVVFKRMPIKIMKTGLENWGDITLEFYQQSMQQYQQSQSRAGIRTNVVSYLQCRRSSFFFPPKNP